MTASGPGPIIWPMTLALRLFALVAAPARGSSFHDGREAVNDAAARAAERSLVVRIRAGDAAAFAGVMEQHFRAAVRFATGFLHDRTEAEDVAQEVFTRIWTGRTTWEPKTSVRAYVLGSIRHRALNVLKHQGVETRYATSVGVDHERVDADESSTIEHVAEVVALRVAIEGLPERRRIALTLRYEHEMSHAEVGAVLGVSAKAAKELLARTLEALHTKLAKLR